MPMVCFTLVTDESRNADELIIYRSIATETSSTWNVERMLLVLFQADR